jgi:hypothetical protein
MDQRVPIEEIKTYPIAERAGPSAKVKPWVDQDGYRRLYKESMEQPEQFWDRVRVTVYPRAPPSGSYRDSEP